MIKNKKISMWFYITGAALIFTLIFPNTVTYYCKIALGMCAASLIPSIFIFTVLSRIISHFASNGFFSGKTTIFLSRLLNLPCCLIPTCFLGFFCSAPSGAFAISKIYSDGLCTKKEAQKACILANNCSAAFIFSVIGAMTESVVYAAIIFISNIISVLIIYFLFFRDKTKTASTTYKPKLCKHSFFEILCESISSSAELTVRICAYVVFFATFGTMIADALSIFFKEIDLNTNIIIKGAVCSFFEMTSGIICLGASEGFEKIMLIAGAVSFCGLSVIFQVMGIFDKNGIDNVPFILSRFLCALTTPIITLVFLFIIPESLSVFSSTQSQKSSGFTYGDLISLITVTVLFFIGGAIIAYLDKKHKK